MVNCFLSVAFLEGILCLPLTGQTGDAQNPSDIQWTEGDVIQGQEALDLWEAKVVGELSDGSSLMLKEDEASSEPNNRFRIRNTVNHRKDEGEGNVQFNVIEKPELSLPEEGPPKTRDLSPEESAQLAQSIAEQRDMARHVFPGICFITATIYDQEVTYLNWMCGGEQYEGWSNVNFNHLTGFTQFQGRGSLYNLVLVVQNSTKKVLAKNAQSDPESLRYQLPELPTIEAWGPGYMVISGDESNEEGFALMDALHDLYDNDSERLIEAHRKRLVNQELAKEQESKIPKNNNTTLHYWTGKGGAE